MKESINNLDADVRTLIDEVHDLRTEVAAKPSKTDVDAKASRNGVWGAVAAGVLATLLAIGGAVHVNNLRVQAAEDACERGNLLRAGIVAFVEEDILGPDDPSVPNSTEDALEGAIIQRTRERFPQIDCSSIR